MMSLEFLAQLWRISRDHEDETKITFLCDPRQLQKVLSIPAQTLLRIKVVIEEEGVES